MVVWGLSVTGGVGWGGPWHGGYGGLSLVGSFVIPFYVAVFHIREPASPWCGRVFAVVLNSFGATCFDFLSQKQNNRYITMFCGNIGSPTAH